MQLHPENPGNYVVLYRRGPQTAQSMVLMHAWCVPAECHPHDVTYSTDACHQYSFMLCFYFILLYTLRTSGSDCWSTLIHALPSFFFFIEKVHYL